MSNSQVCFSHGQESGPWGSKITALAALARAAGRPVESLDYRGMATVAERTAHLLAHLDTLREAPLLVGSSMGAYVALQAARQRPVAGLFLLAPALYMPGYDEVPESLPGVPVMVVHGWRDEVVPYAGSVRFGEAVGAEVLLLDGDHRLSGVIGRIGELFAGWLGKCGRD